MQSEISEYNGRRKQIVQRQNRLSIINHEEREKYKHFEKAGR